MVSSADNFLMKIKTRLLFLTMMFSLIGHTATAPQSPELAVYMERSAYNKMTSTERYSGFFPTKYQQNGPWIRFPANEQNIRMMSGAFHQANAKCGGFFVQDKKTPFVFNRLLKYQGKPLPTHPDIVKPLLSQINGDRIFATIKGFSKFEDRYYGSKLGKDVVDFIQALYIQRSAGRSDITVEKINHASWGQPSIRARIIGTKYPEKIVVVGGHLDSINSGFSSSKAPGEDDNASGSAVVLEAFTVIAQSGFRPDVTLEFMGYAAEEVGLRGSNEIASVYAKNRAQVLGAIQFDMVLKKPAKNSITLINDYTHPEQNKFVAALVDTYVGIPWVFDKCGYACSDHASWTKAGYAASFPFETPFDEYNHNIHSDKDTIEQIRATPDHATNYAKIAIAFAVEQSLE